MRLWLFLVAAALAWPLPAQDTAPKKKRVEKKQVVHKKPTPEQIRKFKELEKKQK